MRALLTLYMVNEFFLYITDEAYREEISFGIFAAYGSLVYATPVLGGMIADKYIGFKKSIMLGGILMALGHFYGFYFDSDILGMNVQSINSFFFYAALALLIVGNGFLNQIYQLWLVAYTPKEILEEILDLLYSIWVSMLVLFLHH